MNVFWLYHLHFTDFIKINKIVAQLNLNYFQKTLLYFFPFDEFNFFGLSTDAPYFKSRFMKRWHFFHFFIYFFFLAILYTIGALPYAFWPLNLFLTVTLYRYIRIVDPLTLPLLKLSSSFINRISVRFYENDCILHFHMDVLYNT